MGRYTEQQTKLSPSGTIRLKLKMEGQKEGGREKYINTEREKLERETMI